MSLQKLSINALKEIGIIEQLRIMNLPEFSKWENKIDAHGYILTTLKECLARFDLTEIFDLLHGLIEKAFVMELFLCVSSEDKIID